MKLSHKLKVLLLFFATAAITVIIYLLWSKDTPGKFSCIASFSQHYSSETIEISLGFMFDGGFGMASINGRSRTEPGKKINRKISFTTKIYGGVYFLNSQSNNKFPDDNVSDDWLSKYEPDFFVFPGKEMHIRIEKQKNKNYLFMVSTLPTYICNNVVYN